LKIFTAEEIKAFKKMLSVLPSFKQVLTTDKYYYSMELYEVTKTKEAKEKLKAIVLGILKKMMNRLNYKEIFLKKSLS